MKRLVTTAVLAFVLGGGAQAVASGLLVEHSSVPAAFCQGSAGYAGMNADGTIIFVCTSDGQLHMLEAH